MRTTTTTRTKRTPTTTRMRYISSGRTNSRAGGLRVAAATAPRLCLCLALLTLCQWISAIPSSNSQHDQQRHLHPHDHHQSHPPPHQHEDHRVHVTRAKRHCEACRNPFQVLATRTLGRVIKAATGVLRFVPGMSDFRRSVPSSPHPHSSPAAFTFGKYARDYRTGRDEYEPNYVVAHPSAYVYDVSWESSEED